MAKMKDLYKRQDGNDSRGRRLISTENIEKGRLIFCERPLLSLQSFGNTHSGSLVCRNCRCFVGGPKLSLALSSNRITRQNILDFKSQTKKEYSIVPCRHACGEIYCSSECEQEMIDLHGHDLICTGILPDESSTTTYTTINEDESKEFDCIKDEVQEPSELKRMHPLLEFKIHAIQSNEIFLMVADFITNVIALRRRQILHGQSNHSTSKETNIFSHKQNISDILTPYMDFTLVPWWDVATQSDTKLSDSEKEHLDTTLRLLCDDSAALLKKALMHINEPPSTVQKEFYEVTKQAIHDCLEYKTDLGHSLVSGIFFGKLIGSFEQNAIGLRARHPLCRDIFSKDLREDALYDLSICIANTNDADEEEEEDEDEEEQDEEEEERDVKDEHNCNDEQCNDEQCQITNLTHATQNIQMESSSNEYDSHVQNSQLESNDTNHPMYTMTEITEYLSSLDIEENDSPNGDDLDALFHPMDGTAMFATTCKMNHSCQPNVLVRYRSGWGKYRPLILQCIALTNISKGEELCISYVNTDGTVKERREELLNYGFHCLCQKCQMEDDNVANGKCIDIQNANEVDNLFGSDDENENDVNENRNEMDSLFGSDDDDDHVDVDDDDDDCEDTNDSSYDRGEIDHEQAFQKRLFEINQNISNHDYPGRIPIPLLAQVSSFLQREGSMACKEFQQIWNNIHPKTEKNDTNAMIQALQLCLKAIQERDFDACQTHGITGENVAFHNLIRNGSWPHTCWRVAYGCFTVTAALGYVVYGRFLESIHMLDKACILGLPRIAIGDFWTYVEYHAYECRNVFRFIPKINVNGLIHNYVYTKDQMWKDGWNKAISLPIYEEEYKRDKDICHRFEKDHVSLKRPIVLRKLALHWSAIHKWR